MEVIPADDNGIRTPQPPAHSFARGPTTSLTRVGPRPDHRMLRNAMTIIVKSADFLRMRHHMNRIDVSTGVDFDEFRVAFEKAAPPVDPAPVKEIAESGGSWDDVKAAVAINAPNDLMVYATIDATQGMALAGHSIKAVEYLLGNHVIAETMFRHDSRALLYAPLRVLLYSDPDGNAVFSMDQ